MRFVQIEFMDGSKEVFSFAEHVDNPVAQRMRIEDLLQSQTVIIASDTEVIAFPVANIKSMRFTLREGEADALPLPAGAFRGAERR